MGNLKEGVKYIYERQNNVVYAREFGADPSTRQVVGWDWEPETNPSRVRGASHDSVMENQLWYDIRQEAKTNPTLQTALDRVIMLYKLSKDQYE